MSKPLSETVSKEMLKEWLKKVFALCHPRDLEDVLEYEPYGDFDDEDLVEYAADKYVDDLYPVIFDHFKFRPYMSGHDEEATFFEHEYLYGDVLELDSLNVESYTDGVTEYDLWDVFYLVATGDVVHCMSFHFKSRTVEFTHEFLVDEASEDDDIDAYAVCELFDSIIDPKEE